MRAPVRRGFDSIHRRAGANLPQLECLLIYHGRCPVLRMHCANECSMSALVAGQPIQQTYFISASVNRQFLRCAAESV